VVTSGTHEWEKRERGRGRGHGGPEFVRRGVGTRKAEGK